MERWGLSKHHEFPKSYWDYMKIYGRVIHIYIYIYIYILKTSYNIHSLIFMSTVSHASTEFLGENSPDSLLIGVVRQWKQVETSVLSTMEFTPNKRIFMDIYDYLWQENVGKTYFNSICNSMVRTYGLKIWLAGLWVDIHSTTPKNQARKLERAADTWMQLCFFLIFFGAPYYNGNDIVITIIVWIMIHIIIVIIKIVITRKIYGYV